MSLEDLQRAVTCAKIDKATVVIFNEMRVFFFRENEKKPDELEQTGYTNMDDEYVCTL